jgi:hypothetical protein
VSSETVLCPSSRCEPGAILLGIRLPNGRVHFAHDVMEVSDEFAVAARSGRSPGARFRFSSPCVRGACRQWTGERCGVIDLILEHMVSPDGDLPACPIRDRCRWFHQSGTEACRICPLVSTDVRVDVPEKASSVGATSVVA